MPTFSYNFHPLLPPHILTSSTRCCEWKSTLLSFLVGKPLFAQTCSGESRTHHRPPQRARSSPPSSPPCGRRLRPHWGKVKKYQRRSGRGGGGPRGADPKHRPAPRRLAWPPAGCATPSPSPPAPAAPQARCRPHPRPGGSAPAAWRGRSSASQRSAAGGSGAQGGGVRQRPRDPRGARRTPRCPRERSPTRRYASFQCGAARPGALYSSRCPRSGSSITARRPPHSARRRAARRDL